MVGKYLITTKEWFHGKDGKQYKAVLGECALTAAGDIRVCNASGNHMIIAKDQVGYAMTCANEDVINISDVEEYTIHDGQAKRFTRPTNIYIVR